MTSLYSLSSTIHVYLYHFCIALPVSPSSVNSIRFWRKGEAEIYFSEPWENPREPLSRYHWYCLFLNLSFFWKAKNLHVLVMACLPEILQISSSSLPEERSLLLLSDSADFSLLTKPKSKGPLGGGSAGSPFRLSSWRCWPELHPETPGLLGSTVRQQGLSVDASCIIDKMCLGELEWVFAVRVLQCRRCRAHKLKAKAWHVVCAVRDTTQTQAETVIHLSFEACV